MDSTRENFQPVRASKGTVGPVSVGPEVATMPDPGVDDETQLLLKARGGDRSAFGRVIESTQDRLFNALLRMTHNHDDALELTQETYARALQKIAGFRGQSQSYTWLFRIGMNLAISRLRQNRRRMTHSLDISPTPGGKPLVDRLGDVGAGGPEQASLELERREMVLKALAQIDPEDRALLVMRDVEGFDYQQMADLLEVPMGTLKSRLFRARRALQKVLDPYLAL